MGCLKIDFTKPYIKDYEPIIISLNKNLTSNKSIKNTQRTYYFGFNGQEKDDEVYGAGNLNTAEFWQYDTRIGRRWNLDPVDQVYISNYSVFTNNPISFSDVLGNIPFPLKEKFKTWGWRIDSWFGPRNTGLAGASKNHKGLDYNYKGGGSTDLGSPILTTHNGTVTVDNSTNGGEGRMVTVTSPDNTFRTLYMHLSEITVTDGQEVTESDIIGKMGGSANGSETGRAVHLHYAIQKYNSETKKWEAFDPTEGKGKKIENIVDPQKWITPSESTSPPINNSSNYTDKRNVFQKIFEKVRDVLPLNKNKNIDYVPNKNKNVG